MLQLIELFFTLIYIVLSFCIIVIAVLMEFPNFPPKENELFQTLNDEDKAKVM